MGASLGSIRVDIEEFALDIFSSTPVNYKGNINRWAMFIDGRPLGGDPGVI